MEKRELSQIVRRLVILNNEKFAANGNSVALSFKPIYNFNLGLVIMFTRNLIVNICRKLGFYPSRLIKKTDLPQINQFLRPIDNGIDLVRIGPPRDGGYLLPDDFADSEICFSAGVSNKWGFEKDLFEKTGISSYMYDGSVNAPVDLTSNHRFTKKFIGASTHGDFISITDVLTTDLKNYKNIIGQIDIEGFEYDLFKTLSTQDLNRFNIIVCEFHNCELWIQNRYYFENILPMFTKILSLFDLVHSHVNNAGGQFSFKGQLLPRIIELTFHRKDRAKKYKGFRVTPNKLDNDNIE